MKLQLDPTHCNGAAVCSQILPEVVHLDTWGYPVLGPDEGTTGFERDRRSVEIPKHLEHLAHRAVFSCPRLALQLDK